VVDGEASFAVAVVEGEEDRPGQWNLFQYTSHVTASKGRAGESLLVIDSTAILLSLGIVLLASNSAKIRRRANLVLGEGKYGQFLGPSVLRHRSVLFLSSLPSPI